MKIRNGFVSNSSSSSFIVGCKKIPESVEDMEKLIGEVELSYKIYPNGYHKDAKTEKVIITSKEIAKQVFNDMEPRKKKKKLIRELENGSISSRGKNIEKLEDIYITIISEEIQISRNDIKEKLMDENGCFNFNSYYIMIMYMDYNEVYSKAYIKAKEHNSIKENNENRIFWKDFLTKEESDEFTKITEKVEKYYSEFSKEYSKFSEENLLKNEKMFKVSYSDEEGSYFSAFEHGGIFKNVDHSQISYH